MNHIIGRDFLILFQCIIDSGAEVLRDFTEEKIKSKYKTDDIGAFWKHAKHYFYHQWDKKKLECCECNDECCIETTGNFNSRSMYSKMYVFDKSIKWGKGHQKKNGSITIRTCICRYTARSLQLEELDLSDLYNVLLGLEAINPSLITKSEATLIKDIMTVRAMVCHAVTSTTFSEHELKLLWEKFTNALYTLFPGDPKNVKWVKKAIEKTKKSLLGEDDVRELYGKLGITQTDILDFKNCVVNSIKENNEVLMEQLIGYLNKVGIVGRTSSDGADEGQASGGNGQINMTATLDLPSVSREKQIQIVNNLPTVLKVPLEGSEEGIVNIEGKNVNSIVLDLRVSSDIFRDIETLRSALLSLIQQVLEKGKINTNVPDTIYITLALHSRLERRESAVIAGLLTQQISERPFDVAAKDLVNNDKPDSTEDITCVLTQQLSEMSHIDEYEVSTETKRAGKCPLCNETDENIKQLERRIIFHRGILSIPDDRILPWLDSDETDASSDSGIGRSVISALNEDFSCISLDLVQLEESLKDLMEDLDISKRMWLAVGISLYTIIANALRIYVNKCFSGLYESMVTSDNIGTQMFPNYLKMYTKSNSHLNYEEINGNKIIHGNEIHKYDYKVLNHVDLSKLFLPTGIAQYEDFELTCSLSSLFKIINHVDIFKEDVKDISREVESNIRKIWARCDVTKWNEVQFLSSFTLMEKFVTKLQLKGDDESILKNLKRWKNIVNIPDKLHRQLSDTPHFADTETKQEQTRSATTGFGHGFMGQQLPIYCIRCKKHTSTINSVVLLMGRTKTRVVGSCALCCCRKSMYI